MNSGTLEQGDVLRAFPIVVIPDNKLQTAIAAAQSGGTAGLTDAGIGFADVIVVSQSCDLAVQANGQRGADRVLACRLITPGDGVNDGLFASKHFNGINKFQRPTYHALLGSTHTAFQFAHAIVDLLDVFTLNVDLAERHARKQGDRLRLLHPYRQGLSNRFGQCYSRVEYPLGIPAVK